MNLNPKIGDYYITKNNRILKVKSRCRQSFDCEILGWHTSQNVYAFYYTGSITISLWHRNEYNIVKKISPQSNPELFL